MNDVNDFPIIPYIIEYSTQKMQLSTLLIRRMHVFWLSRIFNRNLNLHIEFIKKSCMIWVIRSTNTRYRGETDLD